MAPKDGIRRIDVHEIDSVFYGEIEIGIDLFGGFVHEPFATRAMVLTRIPVLPNVLYSITRL